MFLCVQVNTEELLERPSYERKSQWNEGKENPP